MGLFNRSKPEIKNKAEFNIVHVHILEETVRGDLIKIGQFKKRISRNNEDKTIFIRLFGEKVEMQHNELLHRADGSKDFFILREGLGVFKPLTLFHYSNTYFEKTSDTEILQEIKGLKQKALYLKTMNVNEKQVYKNTLKGIYSRGLGFWDKHGPLMMMILIFVLGIGALIYMGNSQIDQAEIYANAMKNFGQTVATAINSTSQTIPAYNGG